MSLYLLAQATTKPGTGGGGVGAFDLFMQSFDVFTVLLVIASLAAGAFIVRAIIEITPKNITNEESERTLRRLLQDGNMAGLESYLQRDTSFYAAVIRAAHATPHSSDRGAVRAAAELAAAEQCGKWFRKIEPLNVIGNLGPLLGLAGTVWGMVLAFGALKATGGQASTAGDLSAGIAKALFHTLLGLLVALPALLVFGLYRTRVDGLCTKAMAVAAELVELYIEARKA